MVGSAIRQAIDQFLDSLRLKSDGTRDTLVARFQVRNDLDEGLGDYHLRPSPTVLVYLNEMLKPQLLQLDGIGETLAALIEAEALKRPFTSREDIRARTRIAEGRSTRLQNTAGFNVRIYRR